MPYTSRSVFLCGFCLFGELPQAQYYRDRQDAQIKAVKEAETKGLFRPKIRKTGTAAESNQKTFAQRVKEKEELRKRKLEERISQLREEEEAQCTFAPVCSSLVDFSTLGCCNDRLCLSYFDLSCDVEPHTSSTYCLLISDVRPLFVLSAMMGLKEAKAAWNEKGASYALMRAYL
jgi:hypothetical protein